MVLFTAGQVLLVGGLLLVLPTMVRCLPDGRRSWQLRWSRSSEVRPDLVAGLRAGRPASTPALASDVLEYVVIMRRGLAVVRSDVYRVAAALFTVAGLLWMVNGVRLGSPVLVLCALVLASHPLWVWAYTFFLAGKLDRAERANADLVHRPELYLVPDDCVDVISNDVRSAVIGGPVRRP